jgi:hypothetical protein
VATGGTQAAQIGEEEPAVGACRGGGCRWHVGSPEG